MQGKRLSEAGPLESKLVRAQEENVFEKGLACFLAPKKLAGNSFARLPDCSAQRDQRLALSLALSSCQGGHCVLVIMMGMMASVA